jgi:transcription-repair coupling factor (superfamily II helicase)
LEFKNLGVVIIDEEHKFGVKQKEKIKTLYHNVHLLSMSATPIPRSLNQALSSIKTKSQL